MKLAFIGYGPVIKKQIEKAKSCGHEIAAWIIPKNDFHKEAANIYNTNMLTYAQFKEKGATADLFLINECAWFIPTSFFNGTPAINFHAGLLPKWRGFSSNLWAILNDEKEIGYSVNIATDELDGGDIVYQFKMPNDFKSFYAEMREKIIADMVDSLDVIIENFNLGNRNQNQNSEAFYCVRMNPAIGVIEDWNLTSNQIFNLYRIFGHTSSSGLFVKKEGISYHVKQMQLSDLNSTGVAGAVVYNNEEFNYVNTRNGVVSINIGKRFPNGTFFDGWKLIFE